MLLVEDLEKIHSEEEGAWELQKIERIEAGEKPEAFTYLLEAENVLLSPHIAGWTFESHQKLAQTIVNKVVQYYKTL